VIKNTDISLRALWRPLVPVRVKEVAPCMQKGRITEPLAVCCNVIRNQKFDLFLETHIDRQPSLMRDIPLWIKTMTAPSTASSECIVNGTRHAKFSKHFVIIFYAKGEVILKFHKLPRYVLTCNI